MSENQNHCDCDCAYDYDVYNFITDKLAEFPWGNSASKLKKNVIELIDSFGENRCPIAGLCLHILYDAVEEKQLGEIVLNKDMIINLRLVISNIRIYLKSKIDPLSWNEDLSLLTDR
ncbi:hypothetical protein XBP1_660003 [Xenorhabdus bovienii str. puntauvense]|uniref:Uncharacterized protein n=1 Tax=Xenorhabdus bovienii str. puntauvense TaxID=1398201 RepID=A0A077NL28_XENBV|nr:hypothetical protein [Xenorhabdus bovienii]CDG99007.1 hypothetical protein XBP1_660003 [Xenorhabdus bovienii str. puntauvense]